MEKPVYKIETYTGAVKDHTITKDVHQIHIKEVATNGCGIFSFIVPTVKGVPGTYLYDDIAIGDKVKIWLDHDSLPADPLTVGKVWCISAPLSMKDGFVRVISGFNQGEVLLRRHKTKYWHNIDASVIVTELANDLSLGTGEIVADTTDEILEVCNEPYWTVLQKVSDYWASAGTQVKKDFYVDIDNNLVWKARPIRTSGVETLTVGDNIEFYTVHRDYKPVFNNIKVYGARGVDNPSDRDSITETSTTGWTLEDDGGHTGTVTSDATTYKVNTRSIKGHTTGCVADSYWLFKHHFSSTFSLFDYDFTNLHFWIYTSATIPEGAFHIRLYASDSSNYFRINPNRRLWNEWKEFDVNLRHFDSFTGNPGKTIIADVTFYLGVMGPTAWDVYVDGLYFSGKRYYNSATTGSADKQHAVTDPNLVSDGECQKRAETLLYQHSSTPIRIDAVCKGNPNIKIGDRLSMTIPAENISAANYDVVVAEHLYTLAQGFTSNASMVNTPDIRAVPPITKEELIRHHMNIQKRVARGLQIA